VTRVGPVTLTVVDLPRAVAFYAERLGFRVHAQDEETARLGAGDLDLLVLVGRPNAPQARGTTGLFHFAVLLPSRADLAAALARLVATRTPLQGASDHLVSEAVYLADPEGNGIELYRDRPRGEWRWEDATIRMTVDPLDVDALLAEAEAADRPWSGLPATTVIGHVHLKVAHIAPAERFYCGVLGFDLTTRYGSMASFVSKDGYHHHIAFNTWSGVGLPPLPDGAAGLRRFVIRFGSPAELDSALSRAEGAGLSLAPGGVLYDPSGNAVKLEAA
jgi:catechol 2,3-dioxygenase